MQIEGHLPRHYLPSIVRLCGKLEMLDRLLPKLKATGHRVSEFYWYICRFVQSPTFCVGSIGFFSNKPHNVFFSNKSHIGLSFCKLKSLFPSFGDLLVDQVYSHAGSTLFYNDKIA